MFVRSRTFYSNICIACKDSISSQNKSHTHTPSKLIQPCCSLGQGRALAVPGWALWGPSPRGRVPTAPPRADRWIIKREITSSGDRHSQPDRRRMVKARHQYGSQLNPCLPQAKIWISVPCTRIWSNPLLFLDGLVQHIMTTLKCLCVSPEKCRTKKTWSLKLAEQETLSCQLSQAAVKRT